MVGIPIGLQVCPASVDRTTPSARAAAISVSVSSHRKIVARAHHRPTLPTGALVPAGQQAKRSGGQPGIAGNVKRIYAAVQFNHRILHLLLDVDCASHSRLA